MLEDAWTTPAVLEGAWTGSVTLEDAQSTPVELEDAQIGPSICACLLQATHELSNTHRIGFYISPEKSLPQGVTPTNVTTPWGEGFSFQGLTQRNIFPYAPPSTAPQSHFKQGMRSSKITVSIARLHSNPVNNDMSGLSQLSASISLVHAEQDQPSPRATWVLAPTDTHGCLHMPR